jgi:hypothetical protein
MNKKNICLIIMRQVTTIIISIFVIVYLVLKIHQKPNFEFFLSDNKIPNEPRFVKGEFQNGGINVSWNHPRNSPNVSHYEIYIEDVRDRNNRIPAFIVRDQNNSENPRFIVRNEAILGDKQYRVSMKAINNNGKSIISNRVVTSIQKNTTTNTSISSSTANALDADSERFKQQESDQNIQNKSISELKKRVDALRNDIVVLKNKEKEENRSIYNQVDMEDSLSQIPGSVRDRFGMNLPSEIEFNFSIDPTL